MTRRKTLETDVWVLTVPDDWSEKDSEKGESYFESSDSTKGMYISTWTVSNTVQSHKEALSSFLAAEEKGFSGMRNSEWEQKEKTTSEGAISLAILDSYDNRNFYRIELHAKY